MLSAKLSLWDNLAYISHGRTERLLYTFIAAHQKMSYLSSAGPLPYFVSISLFIGPLC